MSRLRSFEAPHKGLRNVLGQFSFLLGHTDFKDPAQLETLKKLGTEMFTLLHDHVNTENTHTLMYLEERAPGSSEHDRHDHEELEIIQHSLQDELSGFTGDESDEHIHAFYLDFSMYHSQYLDHIYAEETVTELLLHEHFTDEELMQHRAAIMQKIEFPIMLIWIKYIIPAMREDQSIGMLSGFKANAPKPAFDQVLAVIKEAMDPQRFESLIAKL